MISTFLISLCIAFLAFAAARHYYRRPAARLAPDYEREMTYLEVDVREYINVSIHRAEVEARIMRRISKLPPTFVDAGAQLVQMAQAVEAHGRKMLGSSEIATPPVLETRPTDTTQPSAAVSVNSARWPH